MKSNQNAPAQPRFGIQGSVVAWKDPWAPETSDRLMRTGTGAIVPAQEPTPSPAAFMRALKDELGADFYVHHVMPSLEDQRELMADALRHEIDIVLGNEYGNINGPWTHGTNRYDLPDEAVFEAAGTGRLIGLLYDEPEHLQINAGQYRKDGWFPHFGDMGTEGGLEGARGRFVRAVAERVSRCERLIGPTGFAPVPVLAEQVFPTLVHAMARAGMAPCPKIMKEEFQPLQLAVSLGAAKQYRRPLWICADLWGPDVGEWPIRLPGFPGHSPEEFASALRMGYLMGPTHLFAENADALLSYDAEGGFRRSVFGDVWREFVREFVPAHPLDWTHLDADPDIVLIHSDDSDYGQGERPFGSRGLPMPPRTASVFRAWHLLSHGTLPAHGNNMHIRGYDFPRHELKRLVPAERFPLPAGFALPGAKRVHRLFYPMNNVLVLDGYAEDEQLGRPRLIVVAGDSVSDGTLRAVRRRAEQGAVVVAADWLLPAAWREPRRFAGGGLWLPVADLLGDDAREAAAPLLGSPDRWTQRFGEREVRISPGDPTGETLTFEIARTGLRR